MSPSLSAFESNNRTPAYDMKSFAAILLLLLPLLLFNVAFAASVSVLRGSVAPCAVAHIRI